MDYRSPLENIISIFGTLPQGHDKPVKHAVYNALAIFLLVLGCAAGWALYLILEPFIKPLMWALLVGSVLHPLKYKLAQRCRAWFAALEESNTPVIFGILLVPVKVTDKLSEVLGNKLLKHLKFILTIVISVPTVHIIYYYTPLILVNFICSVIYNGSWFISFLIDNSNTTLVLLLVICYASAVIVLWKPENNFKFHMASVIFWLIVSCYLANLCGSFKVPVFVVLQVISFGGLIMELQNIQYELMMSESGLTLGEYLRLYFENKKFEIYGRTPEIEIERDISENTHLDSGDNEQISDKKNAKSDDEQSSKSTTDPWTLELFQSSNDSKEKRTGILITDKGNIHVIKQPENTFSTTTLLAPKVKRSLSQPSVSTTAQRPSPRYNVLNWKRTNSLLQIDNLEESNSDFYLYSVMWACASIFFWRNLMLLPILPIPILIYTVKHVGNYLGVWKWIYNYWLIFADVFCWWFKERYDALVPFHLRGLWKCTYSINQSLKQGIKESIDTVSSCVVIIGLIVFVTCASIFIAVQIYAEGIMLVQMTSNVINQTVVHNPELRQLLPPTFDDTVDSLLDNAYQYGREGISKLVKSMMSDVDPHKSEKFEKQVLELWDRVYQSWMTSDDAHGPKVSSEAVQHSWDNFVKDIKKSPELFNVNGIMAFLKQNIGTLLSLLESVWGIVKGNMGLLIGSFSALMSILLGGSTAVLNFGLNTVIFLTTLFYLLSSSGYLYKPVELMSNFSSSSSRFGLAFGVAINGVFTASFKMVAFYGMWTWFIHSLFGVKIVYVPTVLAAVLAAAPFLGTYWACIPAVLDLWLAQGSPICAILIAIFQFLPTSIVDTTIYGEIKGGGHPYLTGLAIAGGIFCLGLEGAIIGPLILCGLYVAIDLSSNLFKDSPSEESINLQHLSRFELRKF
ncbi:transmembrane protein 245 [Onthophagus taurus]|uniref:transmembrane protein 245 n=1 Tax=Onthophagus taurus TaxID=166361 RepID=UPI0039BE8DF0